jgi:hypothetical protein
VGGIFFRHQLFIAAIHSRAAALFQEFPMQAALA